MPGRHLEEPGKQVLVRFEDAGPQHPRIGEIVGHDVEVDVGSPGLAAGASENPSFLFLGQGGRRHYEAGEKQARGVPGLHVTRNVGRAGVHVGGLRLGRQDMVLRRRYQIPALAQVPGETAIPRRQGGTWTARGCPA